MVAVFLNQNDEKDTVLSIILLCQPHKRVVSSVFPMNAVISCSIFPFLKAEPFTEGLLSLFLLDVS